MLRKTVAAVAALGLGFVLALSAAAPASAMEVRPPAPPGASQRWGQPVSTLPVVPHADLVAGIAVPPPDRGGWINEPFYHQTGAPPVNNVPPAVTSPAVFRLGDLVRYISPSGASSFGFYAYGFMKKDNRTNPTPSVGDFSVTASAVQGQLGMLPTGNTRCSSSEWLDGNAIVMKGYSGGGGTMYPTVDKWGQTFMALTGTTGCQNIVSISLNVCWWVKGLANKRCEQVTWLAEDNYGAGPDADGNYQSVPYAGANKDWETQMCKLDMNSSTECIYLLQDRVDGTDFDAVCANAPAPQWLDFSWLGEWTGHMARCLFAPANGFDRDAWVSDAWTGGPGGAIAGIAVKTGQAFNIGETCGQLFSGDPRGAMKTVTMNTCSWSAWAGPLKTVLGIWATVAFGMWAIGFLINCVAGVVNRRVPNPVAEGAE